MIGSLTLDQLRILVTIADTGSFSAASRLLLRAQSSISQAIATLENVQGVQLFDRSSHRPQLTPTGQALVTQARAVLKSADQFEAMAAGSRQGIEAELAIAIDPLVPTEACVNSLQALNNQFPHLAVRFYTEGLGGAERRLQQGDVALAFGTLLPSVPDWLIAYPLITLEMVPVVAAAHPLAALNRPVRLAELESHTQLVLSAPESDSSPSYGVLSTRQWRFVELHRRLDFLLAGFGWCRMPTTLVAPMLADGSLKQLTIEGDPEANQQRLPIYASHRRDQGLGRAGSWLLNHLLRKN
ncbi:LysR family transcriptional regulator [Pokkaliibacter sp. CJK22405]|uniref:LysR family transcriptional regulator n=1 Tax=Pokkaliibacter sp. CJK22405 TaxID=3384615 RepID=UPI003984E7FA